MRRILYTWAWRILGLGFWGVSIFRAWERKRAVVLEFHLDHPFDAKAAEHRSILIGGSFYKTSPYMKLMVWNLDGACIMWWARSTNPTVVVERNVAIGMWTYLGYSFGGSLRWMVKSLKIMFMGHRIGWLVPYKCTTIDEKSRSHQLSWLFFFVLSFLRIHPYIALTYPLFLSLEYSITFNLLKEFSNSN